MPIDTANLESAIRKALNCVHIEIEDQSSGCGENYAILLVSEDFEGKSTLMRHRWSASFPLCAHVLAPTQIQ
jgi:stress-induced morphogen